MYKVPNEPHGEPGTRGSWLRDLSALTLAVLVLVYGILSSVKLGIVLSQDIAPGGVLGPIVALGGLIFVIALCVTLSKRYGESKRQSKVQVLRAWLALFAATVAFIACYLILDSIHLVP